MILTLFNWMVEITKWQLLVKKIHPITWRVAAIQTLASSAFAMITPVRTGEYGIKILYYTKSLRKEIAFAAFAGNIYQLLTSLMLGALGIIYLYKYFDTGFISIVLFVFLTTMLMMALFFLLKNKFTLFNRLFLRLRNIFRFNENKINRNAFLLSLLRYLIFSHQFYFLTVLFELELTYLDTMACITAMYGLTSVVPIIPLFDFLLKGSVSILVFSFFNVEPIWIVCIALCMWILNFAIPAILGSHYILRLKLNPTT